MGFKIKLYWTGRFSKNEIGPTELEAKHMGQKVKITGEIAVIGDPQDESYAGVTKMDDILQVETQPASTCAGMKKKILVNRKKPSEGSCAE